MTRGRLVFVLLSLACLLPVVGGSLSRAATDDDKASDSLSKQLSVFTEVLSLIRRAYVEEASVDALLTGALEGTGDALDPLATFVPAEEVAEFDRARDVGSRHSGLLVFRNRGIPFVVAVEAGSPAAEAGVEQGDVIAEIGGLSTRTLPFWKLQSLLAGETGDEVELELLRLGQTKEVSFELAAFERAPVDLDVHEDVSVLRLPRFDQETVAEVRSLLGPARARSKMVIDVRGVAGGDAAAAYQLAGLFATGELGELKGRDGTSPLDFESTAEPVWEGDLVVLIDDGSFGSAEVFAAVLQQKAEARLVGRRSVGHAGRQSTVTLSNGSRLMLTDAFFTGPDGEPIDEPLAPDVVVRDSFRRLSETDEESRADPVLERGLELLSEEAA